MAELDDTGHGLLARLADLNSRIADLTEAADEVKDQLRAHCGTGAFTDQTGARALSITPNRRFDPDLATQVLPAELVALCTVSSVDAKTARRNLPPALFEQCMKEVGKPVVKLG